MFARFPDGDLWERIVPYLAKPWSRAAARHDLSLRRNGRSNRWIGDLTQSQLAELSTRWGWPVHSVLQLDMY
jgi:hypothetical protein